MKILQGLGDFQNMGHKNVLDVRSILVNQWFCQLCIFYVPLFSRLIDGGTSYC